MPRNSRARLTYIRPAAEMIWPQVRRRPSRSGATGRHTVRVARRTTIARSAPRMRSVSCGLRSRDERARARLDRAAEEIGRTGPENAARRHRVAPLSPALRPLDRLVPLRLQVRAGRAVEERLLPLAPASLERDPGELPPRRLRVARDRLDVRTELDVRAARVVAADARLGGAPDVQGLRELVRVRARGGVDDRPDSVRELELLVPPVGALGPFVRAEADGLGLLVERLARVAGVEDEADHLPVALVQVVEVVERVEEPVLERELPRVCLVGRYVRIDGRSGSSARPRAQRS